MKKKVITAILTMAMVFAAPLQAMAAEIPQETQTEEVPDSAPVALAPSNDEDLTKSADSGDADELLTDMEEAETMPEGETVSAGGEVLPQYTSEITAVTGDIPVKEESVEEETALLKSDAGRTSAPQSENIVSLQLEDKVIQYGAFPSYENQAILRSVDDDKLDQLKNDFESAVDELAEQVDVSAYDMSVGEMTEAVAEFINAHPTYYFVEGVSAEVNEETNAVSSLLLKYSYYVGDETIKYENVVRTILSPIKSSWSEVERLLYLHDYLVTHCQYDFTYSKYSAYDALVDQSAVCNGYALAFEDLANRAGIPTFKVTSPQLNHAWNLVELNKKYYYIDCTWDDPSLGSPSHYYKAFCRHANFLRSESGMVALNHNSNDWYATGDDARISEFVYGRFNDTTYDNAPWQNAGYSPAVCFDGYMMYIDSADWSIYKYTFSNGYNTRIATIGDGTRHWPQFGTNAFYTNCFSTLAQVGQHVYVNDPMRVQHVSPDTGIDGDVYILSEAQWRTGYIYGIQSEGSRIRYDVATGAADTDLQQSYYLDVSGQTGKWADSLTLDKDEIYFSRIGEVASLNATVTPDGAGPVVWTSSDPSVATVSNGKVKAVNYGNAIITAQAGNCKAICSVYLKILLVLDEDEITMHKKGETVTLTPYLFPDDAGPVTWSSSDPSVATVSNGKVKMVNYGHCLIKAVAGNCEAYCNVYCDTTWQDDYEYYRYADGYRLNKYNGNATDVVVPAEIYQGGTKYKTIVGSGVWNGNKRIKSVRMEKGVELQTGWNLFRDCTALKSVDFTKCDTGELTDVSCMFQGCSSLESLDLHSLSFKNISYVYGMLQGCDHLKTIITPGVMNRDLYVPLECEMYQSGPNGRVGSETYDDLMKAPANVALKRVDPNNTDDPVAAFVTRMYRVALGREPDAGGLNSWVSGLKSGRKKGADIAQGFYMSPEIFSGSPTSEEYVELAYLGMMNRASDAGGKADWVDALNSGVSCNAIIRGFVGSQEFHNLCADYGIQPGEVAVTEPRDQNVGVTKFVARLYTKALGRPYDVGGLNDWTAQINANPSKENILRISTNGFLNSQEFLNKNLPNEEFVRVLYRTFLDREADQDGLNDWLNRMANGASRDDIAAGFAGSPEFANVMARYGL